MKKEKVTKKYSLVKEDFNSKTTWSKTKQANAIEQIVKTYPTAAQFKRAIMTTGDEKSKQLVKNMDENMSEEQYIDFLQYVFVKHSTVGKTLATALAGLGLGALTSYLLAKPADEYGTVMGVKKATGVDLRGASGNRLVRAMASNDPDAVKNSAFGKGLAEIEPELRQFGSDIGAGKLKNVISKNGGNDLIDAFLSYKTGNPIDAGAAAGSSAAKIAVGKDEIANTAKDFISNLPQRFGTAVQNLGNKFTQSDPSKAVDFYTRLGKAGGHFYTAAQQYNDTKNLYKNGIQFGGGLAAGAAGAAGAHAIQNWREKQQQNRINALKYRRYYS